MVIRALYKQWRFKAPRPLRERGGGEGAACHSRPPPPRPSPLPQGTRELWRGSVFFATLIALLLTLWLPPLYAAQLNAELDKKISPMGEPLRLRISSTTSLNELDLTPLKNDFEVFTQAASSSSRNGREQSVLEVTLYPLRSGKLTLPSLNLGSARSRPLPVEIAAAAVNLRVWLTPSVPMEREPSTLHLEIRDDGSLEWPIPTQLDAPHITLRSLPEQLREEAREGVTTIVHDYRWSVLPLKSDSLRIAFGMLDANKFGQRLRFPLSDVSFRVRAAPAYLPLHLPIGKPTLRTDPLPKQITVGQPVAWNMDIQAPGLSAAGALKLLQYDTPRGLRFYTPSVTPITLDGNDALRLTLTFVAERGAQTFPALSLAYYDPKQQRIEALNIPAARLTLRDPLREKIIIGILLVASVLLLIWIGVKAKPWLRRMQIKRAWLARIQAAQDTTSLYRALTQETPWRAPTLQHWPTALRMDANLRAQLEQARFGLQKTEVAFSELKPACLHICTQMPLTGFSNAKAA